MKGIIFDIKEFSIHDGPGARITVFMKGCPLRCVWCHNPEGLSAMPQLMHKEKMCTKCGNCKMPCGHTECMPFDRCIHSCPNGCLSVTGKEIEAKALAIQLKTHQDLLSAMNGGITISGGEPLMQAGFVCELLDNLEGIHKAIQTSGYAIPETYRKVIDKCDYIMQDIKLADKDTHKKYTGADNTFILENIEYLKKSGKDFVLRVPVIPSITDTEENLRQISEIAEDFSVEILNYNTMAGAKYKMLGLEYPLNILKNISVDYTGYFKNAVMR